MEAGSVNAGGILDGIYMEAAYYVAIGEMLDSYSADLDEFEEYLDFAARKGTPLSTAEEDIAAVRAKLLADPRVLAMRAELE